MTLMQMLAEGAGAGSRRRQILGVVVGIVRDLKDPQKLGRVKVDFPWLAESADAVTMESGEERAHSYWARVATLMGGAGRGSYFIPEVGDEVLVAFEHGDIDRPCVIGALWNADDRPPETMDGDGKNDIRSITSRSGHRIVLNDSDDQPSILIVDNTGDNSILIDTANNAMTFRVKGNLTFEVDGDIIMKAKGKWTVDATGDAGLQTRGNLEAKATGNAKLEASGPLDVKSNAQVTVEGSAGAELKGAMVTVNGSGMAEIKGGLVKIN